MAYNKDTDYQAIINAAVARGDYKTAAQAEQSRNEKISALNASGTNKYNAAATNKYAGWLDNTDYGTIGKQQMASGASAQDVLNTYNNRYNKAAGTEGLSQYANDEIQKEMWDYITQNIGNDKPVFDFGTGRPTYESSYSSRIDEMLNQILNREDFSYDLESDPMFQQYQTMYNREGSRAMNDTLASAAAGAGGMNSYAVTAAQQANDYYSAQLMDKAPELYQLAYQMYLQDIDNQVRDLGLLQEMDSTQYGRYRDTMSDWANDRDFAYGKYRDEMGDYQWMKDFNYSAGRDKVNDDRYDREWEYGVGRDELEDSRYESETAYNRAMQMLASGVMPGDEALKAAGISPSEAAAYIASNAKTASGSDGEDSAYPNTDGTTAKYYEFSPTGKDKTGEIDTSSFTDDDIKALQQYLGVTSDGEWDEESARAAGGLTADEAWKKYGGIVNSKVGGKPIGEYNEAAGNYQEIKNMADQLLVTQGKDAVKKMLTEAWRSGALNQNDYNTLFSKYRNM